MNKTTTYRRFLTAATAFFGSLVAAFAAAPAAFAMRPVAPSEVVGGASNPAPTVTTATSSGMPVWQIALIVAAAVLIAALVATTAVRVRAKVSLRHLTI